jgi:exosortase
MASWTAARSFASTNRSWLAFAWLAGLLVFCYHVVLRGLAEQWFTNEDMSHGPFVPVLAGYVIWQRRHSLMSLPAKPALIGAAVMLLAVIMLCVGPPTLPTFTLLTRLSFFISVIGTILLVRGVSTLRLLAYPLILVMLMLPVPSFLYDRITLPLQLVASILAEHALDLAGFSVLREGNILNLPGQVLSVAEACSGLRSLLSLTFLGQAYIYLMDTRPWMRWVIAIAVVPIAIISNSGRILLTAWLGSINRAWTEGVVHEWTGWAVFIIAFIALLITHRSINLVVRWVGKKGHYA